MFMTNSHQKGCWFSLFLLFVGPVAFGASSHLKAGGQSDVIAVSFQDHGKESQCQGLSVVLLFDGKKMVPEFNGSTFTTPSDLQQLNASGGAVSKKVRVEVSCNGRTLEFPDVPATWLRSGNWQVGIDYPPFAHFTHHATPEKGAWVSYLGFEPDGYDGVEMQIAHDEPLPGMVAQLLQEQPTATGERARDVAFALAVLKENYAANRKYLLTSLRACLARPKDLPDENGCDYELLDYVVNLYWRGDRSLLQPLLQLARFGRDRVDGTFYADLLEREPETALGGLSALDLDHRRMVCQLAGEDGFSLDGPQFERVQKSLNTSAARRPTAALK